MFGGVKDNTYVDAHKAYALLDMPTSTSPLGRCYGILVLVVRLLVGVLMYHACGGVALNIWGGERVAIPRARSPHSRSGHDSYVQNIPSVHPNMLHLW